MNRRKLISYIIGLCGAGAVPTIVQAASKSDQIDYERYGKVLAEEAIAEFEHSKVWELGKNTPEYNRMMQAFIAVGNARKEIRERYTSHA